MDNFTATLPLGCWLRATKAAINPAGLISLVKYTFDLPEFPSLELLGFSLLELLELPLLELLELLELPLLELLAALELLGFPLLELLAALELLEFSPFPSSSPGPEVLDSPEQFPSATIAAPAPTAFINWRRFMLFGELSIAVLHGKNSHIYKIEN
jgi:hypothetical protein